MAAIGMKRPAEDIIELATPKKVLRVDGAETVEEGVDLEKVLDVPSLAQEEELELQDEDYIPASEEDEDDDDASSDEEVSQLLGEQEEDDEENEAGDDELEQMSESLLDEVSTEGCTLDAEAVAAVRVAAKEYMTEVFEAANLIATKAAGRDHVTAEDIQVAVEIMNRSRALFKKQAQEAQEAQEAEEEEAQEV